MKEEIENTQKLTSHIIEEIKSIKDKAIESENIVQDMCKDIKMLDTAKTNLTHSIETLRKFSDLMVAMEKIKTLCKERNYNDAVGCLKGINILSNFFKPHASIPQVNAAMKEKDEIINKMKLQITDDFSYFFKEISDMDHNNLIHACKLAEVLGRKFRDEVIHIAENFVLKSYKEQYGKAENSNLESVEQR